jgi:hypothetical protein
MQAEDFTSDEKTPAAAFRSRPRPARRQQAGQGHA